VPVEPDTDQFPQPSAQELDGPEIPARGPAKPPVTADGHSVAPDPDTGDRVGEFQLGALLGRGGAGSVFKARGPSHEVVAIKVLAAAKVKRARVVQRFFDEVRAASLVEHPGLIKVLGFIEEEEPRRLAYVMEYVDGEMLRSTLKREHALDLKLAIQVGIQVCEALAALHEGGIVHRDLKPENILLAKPEPGQPPKVKLLDFGVVKFLPVDRTQGGAMEEQAPGTFVGTPRYMAPEQAAGAPVDARADLFSLGVMLFEMITGRCPHEGDSLRDVVLAKLKGAPRITVNPEKEILPQELTDVVDGCLQLKPSLRPANPATVASALREAEMVLFTVGPIRYGDDGATVRSAPGDASEVRSGSFVSVEPHRRESVLPSSSGVPPASAGPLGRPSSVQVTAAVAGGGPTISASRHTAPRVPSAGPQPMHHSGGAVPAQGHSQAGSAPAAPAQDGGRRLILVLVGLVLLTAALVLALAARRFVVPEDAVLLTPQSTTEGPAEVRYKAAQEPSGQIPVRTSTTD